MRSFDRSTFGACSEGAGRPDAALASATRRRRRSGLRLNTMSPAETKRSRTSRQNAVRRSATDPDQLTSNARSRGSSALPIAVSFAVTRVLERKYGRRQSTRSRSAAREARADVMASQHPSASATEEKALDRIASLVLAARDASEFEHYPLIDTRGAERREAPRNEPRLARAARPLRSGRPPRGAPRRLCHHCYMGGWTQLRAALPKDTLAPVPVRQAPCRPVVVPDGRGPGAARVRGYEPRPRGPRPAPSFERLRKTPLDEQGARRIRRRRRTGITFAITML